MQAFGGIGSGSKSDGVSLSSAIGRSKEARIQKIDPAANFGQPDSAITAGIPMRCDNSLTRARCLNLDAMSEHIDGGSPHLTL